MQTNHDAVTIGPNFSESERGNVWLTTEDGTGHMIWINLGEGRRLEIEIVPENYPGLAVTVVNGNDEELARHILRHCGGMLVRKLNVKGMESGEHIPEADD